MHALFWVLFDDKIPGTPSNQVRVSLQIPEIDVRGLLGKGSTVPGVSRTRAYTATAFPSRYFGEEAAELRTWMP